MPSISDLVDNEVKQRLKAAADQRERMTALIAKVDENGPANPNPKEKHMPIDLNTVTDAELGRIFRKELEARKVATLPREREEALEAKTAGDKAEDKARKKDRRARRAAAPLAEIVVSDTLTVPALDLSEVTSMDEVVSATLRSPYNKALFRLGLSEAALDPETTTYRVLVTAHGLVEEAAQVRAAEKAAKAEKPKKVKETALVADISEDDDARVQALVDALGVSKKKARKLLGALG